MRTKTLLIAAAALVAGIAYIKAQVYSANVVGYVSVVATNGYTLVANPLDYDGTGTNNSVVNVIGTNLPVGAQVLTWNPSTGFSSDQYAALKTGNAWGTPTLQLPPGKGFFIYNPSNSVSPIFSGTVVQGNNITNIFATGAGYSLIGGNFPVAGGITTTYGYKPSVSDQVLTWNSQTGYLINQYAALKTGNAWGNGEPQLGPGIGVFLFTTNTHPVISTNFVVQ